MSVAARRLMATVVLCALTASACSVREVQAWFGIRGIHGVTAEQARTIADKVNEGKPAECDSNYTFSCVPNNQAVVHCAGTVGEGPAIGPVFVAGWDHFGVDPDGDKIACVPPPAPPAPPTTAPPVPPATAPPTTMPPDTAPPTTIPAKGDTSFAYVASPARGVISKVDTATLAVVRSFSIGAPIGRDIAIDGDRIFFTTGSAPATKLGTLDVVAGSIDVNYIASGFSGDVLATSPEIPGALFVGNSASSYTVIERWNVAVGVTPTLVKSRSGVPSSNLAEVVVSPDPAVLWVVSGSPYHVVELSTDELVVAPARYVTDAFPRAVAGTMVDGEVQVAAGRQGSTTDVKLFGPDPDDVVEVPSQGNVARQGLAFSLDGQRLFALVRRVDGLKLVTIAENGAFVSGATFSSDKELQTGSVRVDPATGRVFALGGDMVQVYNPDGTFGHTVSIEGARTVVFHSIAATETPPRLGTTRPDAGPPTLSGFSTSRPSGSAPVTSVFSWTIADPDGGSLTCTLDYDADGRFDETVENCTSASSRAHSFAAVGANPVTLRVSDGNRSVNRSVSITAEPASSDPFDIDVRTFGAFTGDQMSAIGEAVARWQRVITAGSPSANVSIEADFCVFGTSAFAGTIDDVLVDIVMEPIDGPGGILAQAGPCLPDSMSSPTRYGVIIVDSHDFENRANWWYLRHVIVHEIAHVLGFGASTNWDALIGGAGTANPTFNGPTARAEWDRLVNAPGGVPLETSGGAGTAGSHWSGLFNGELLGGYLSNDSYIPLSRVSVAAMADLGYHVDLDQADLFTIAGVTPFLRSGPASYDVVLRGGRER